MSAPVLVMQSPARRLPGENLHVPAPSQRVHWATVACLLLTICGGTLAFGAVPAWAYTAMAFGSLCAFLLCWAESMRAGVLPRRSSPLFAPALTFAAIVTFQLAAGATEYAYVTRVEALKYVAYALLIWVATQTLRADRALRFAAYALVCFGAGVAFFAIAQHLAGATKIYWLREVLRPQNMFGPYPNRDHYAGLMEMLVPLPLVLAFSASLPRMARTVLGAAAALMAASAVLSGSRAGMVALAAQLGFLALFTQTGGRGKRYFVVLLLFFIATASLLYWLDASPALLRWKEFDATQEMESGRMAIARDALRMVPVHPITGFGLGTFTTVYPRYRSFYSDVIVNEVHNDYLQVLVETGVLGAGAMLWFIVVLYRSGMMSRRSRRADLRDLIRLGALCGCTGLLVHSFFDFNLHIPANAAMFYLLAAIVCLPSHGDEREGQA